MDCYYPTRKLTNKMYLNLFAMKDKTNTLDESASQTIRNGHAKSNVKWIDEEEETTMGRGGFRKGKEIVVVDSVVDSERGDLMLESKCPKQSEKAHQECVDRFKFIVASLSKEEEELKENIKLERLRME
jgi:hypothetical protein